MKMLYKRTAVILAIALCTVFANAAQIYFQFTDGAAWWGNDGAKFGAIFRAGMSEQDYGEYTSFFTPVSGQAGMYEATVPNMDGIVSVQFLRFNSTATKVEWANLWNTSVIMQYNGSNNLFTANACGSEWNSTTGVWSNYGGGGHVDPPTPGTDGVTVMFRRPDSWTATPHIHVWQTQEPVSGAKVIYEINVMNYSQAGNFNAITNDMARLKDLGVDVLWLMPVFVRGQKDAIGSPYCIKDYYNINPSFGSKQDLKNLVNAAHTNGMEVWLDIACNHTAKDHPWLTEHPEYYGYNPYSPHGWNDVYQLRYDYNGTNTGLYNAMTDVLKYWVSECNIDGYRCDYASGVPVSFWSQARAAVSQIKQITWLAENDDANYMAAFDLDYAWAFNDVLKSFAQNKDVGFLVNKCNELFNNRAYTNHSKMIYLTNHDLSADDGSEFDRFGALYNPLLVLTFTIYDHPLIYMGQEVGQSLSTFIGKQVVNFSDNSEKANFYRYLVKKLVALKHASPALTDGPERGSLTNLNASNGSVYAYERKKGDSSVVVVLNFSGSAVSVSLGNKPAGTYADFIDGGTTTLGGNIQLGAYGYKVFVK